MATTLAETQVLFDGRDLLTLPEREMRAVRGKLPDIIGKNRLVADEDAEPLISRSQRFPGAAVRKGSDLLR